MIAFKDEHNETTWRRGMVPRFSPQPLRPSLKKPTIAGPLSVREGPIGSELVSPERQNARRSALLLATALKRPDMPREHSPRVHRGQLGPLETVLLTIADLDLPFRRCLVSRRRAMVAGS